MISVNFVVAIIAAAVFIIAGIVIAALGRRALRGSDGYGNFWLDGGMPVVGGIAMVVVTAGIAAWGFYPYDMQYHRYTHVQGTVADVQGRLLGDGKSTTQTYAVRLREDGQTYRCDDTRCSLLHEGDRVALWCIREWQYASTPGWGCNFDAGDPVRPS